MVDSYNVLIEFINDVWSLDASCLRVESRDKNRFSLCGMNEHVEKDSSKERES